MNNLNLETLGQELKEARVYEIFNEEDIYEIDHGPGIVHFKDGSMWCMINETYL